MRYEVDGKSVTATCINAEYPRVYAVRIGDDPLLGYLQRSVLSRVGAFLGGAAPDEVGAHFVGSYPTMHEAVERVVRAARSRAISPEVS
jgi:hypothetical protein